MAANGGITEQMVRDIIRQEQLSLKEKQDDMEDRVEILTQQQETLKKENSSLRGEVDQLMLALHAEARRLETLMFVGQRNGSTNGPRLRKTEFGSPNGQSQRCNPFNDSRTSVLYPNLPQETAISDGEQQSTGTSTVSTTENKRSLCSWWRRNVCGPIRKRLGNAVDSFLEHFDKRSELRHKNRRRRRQMEKVLQASVKRNSKR